MANKNVKKSKKLIAIDGGYSFFKICYYNEDGIINLDKVISATALLPEKPIDFSDDDVFQLGADYYCLGPNALSCPKEYILPLETFDDMKNIYCAWLSYIVNKYGNGFDSFDYVIIGLSLAFTDRSEELLSHIYENLNITKENYFILVPQGVSARLCYNLYSLNPLQPAKRGQVKMENYVLADLGFNTIDVALILGGSSSAAMKAGLEKTGVINCAYNLMDVVYKKYGFQIGLKQAQVIIDGSDGILLRRGREIDLTEEVRTIKKKYISDLLNLIENKFSEAIDSVSGILIVGGGANLIKDMMDDSDVVLEIEKHFSRNFIHIANLPEYYNVISYLKIGEKLIDEGKI